ncbi:MAG: Rieske (2Fe-2S) protein, partial [Leucothrix sp.]
MSDEQRTDQDNGEHWLFAKPLAELKENKVTMARVSGKQIAIFDTPAGLRACDNRCPHEGYPLSEGTISDDCTLTCNWHNWKFNLENGDNHFGGDRLRTYPVEVRDDEVWVELSDPPYDARYATIVNSLREAFDDHAYDRIAREVARLQQLGADPLDALRLAIEWSWQKMEFGWTHAFAGMADWLMVYAENPEDAELQLVCLVESIGHLSFDVLREADYPYTEEAQRYGETGFLAAVEQEDQPTALSMLRGGLRDGLQFSDFERGLTRAALAHYNDFGHSLIYVTKVGYLIETLGLAVAEPLLLSFVRGMIFASREDKIPEFRQYQKTLDTWTKQAKTQATSNGVQTAANGDLSPDAMQWR